MITSFGTNGTDTDTSYEEAQKFIQNIDQQPKEVQEALKKLLSENDVSQEDQPNFDINKKKLTCSDILEIFHSMNPIQKLKFAVFINKFMKAKTTKRLIALIEKQNQEEEEEPNFIKKYGGSIGTIAFCLVIYKLINSDDNDSGSLEAIENTSALSSLISGK